MHLIPIRFVDSEVGAIFRWFRGTTRCVVPQRREYPSRNEGRDILQKHPLDRLGQAVSIFGKPQLLGILLYSTLQFLGPLNRTTPYFICTRGSTNLRARKLFGEECLSFLRAHFPRNKLDRLSGLDHLGESHRYRVVCPCAAKKAIRERQVSVKLLLT